MSPVNILLTTYTMNFAPMKTIAFPLLTITLTEVLLIK